MKWKIITWNIAGLPKYAPVPFFPFVPLNTHGDPESRIQQIITKIKKQKGDIILLQEVFTISLIKQIKSAFRKDYWIRSSNKSRKNKLLYALGTGTLGSGLITLFNKQKFNIQQLKFYHFKYLSGEDKLANKGLQVFSIYSKQLKHSLIVINTHLNNPDAIFSRYKNSKNCTLNQIATVKKLFKNYKNKKTIFGGDFNIEKLKFDSCVRNKIDYICVNNFTIRPYSKKILKCKLSDHALLSCIITK